MPPLALILIPPVVAVAGAALTAWRRPGPQLVSAIQHFAAGVIFAAAAGEILPDLKHAGAIWPVVIGGGAGVLTMALIQQLEARTKGPIGLLATVAVDLLIDGLVLGLAFVAGATQGLLLTVALTLEVLFLGLTIAIGLKSASWGRSVGTTALLALLLPVGALLSAPISHMPTPVITGFLAFGLIALLYLVTEELLVEAHEVPDRPWITAMFFLGFLLLLLLADVMESAPAAGPL